MLVARLIFASVVVSVARGHFGAGWQEEHAGSQIWKSSCPSGATGCVASIGRLLQETDALGHSHDSVTFRVRPEEISRTARLLADEGMEYSVMVEDLADHLRMQHESEEGVRALRVSDCSAATGCPAPLLDQYMTFEQIELYLQELQTTYPDVVTLTAQGTTTEGRSIYLVKVAAPGAASVSGKTPAVFIEGGAHAREWISPATVVNILHAQVADCNVGENCDSVYYFMPQVNPDGYDHSWNVDRYWRKNRSNPPQGSSCYGIDLNRNYDHYWGTSGTSSNPCSQVYLGKSPFDAPESVVVRDTLETVLSDTNLDLNLYISYHSYSQLVLYPWGYAVGVPVPDEDLLVAGANIYSTTLKSVYGQDYVAQNSAGLYPASGASDDFAKSLEITLAYTIELRDTGNYGFVLPASQIEEVFEENWAAFKSIVEHAASKSEIPNLLVECENNLSSLPDAQ